jgi:hypothetical protein
MPLYCAVFIECPLRARSGHSPRVGFYPGHVKLELKSDHTIAVYSRLTRNVARITGRGLVGVIGRNMTALAADLSTDAAASAADVLVTVAIVAP